MVGIPFFALKVKTLRDLRIILRGKTNKKSNCNSIVKNVHFPLKMYEIVPKKTTIPTCIFKVNRLE